TRSKRDWSSDVCSSDLGEVGEEPGVALHGLRHAMDPQGRLGDDAQRPFGADEQLARVRPGRGRRGGAQLDGTVRGRAAQAEDVLVDAAVPRRLLTGRPGGDPPADGAELEVLRIVGEREAARLQRLLEVGSEYSGLDGGRQRFLVDVDYPVEAGHTDAHDRGRSEEHTSELQSRFDLVCPLLLEKIIR